MKRFSIIHGCHIQSALVCHWRGTTIAQEGRLFLTGINYGVPTSEEASEVAVQVTSQIAKDKETHQAVIDAASRLFLAECKSRSLTLRNALRDWLR